MIHKSKTFLLTLLTLIMFAGNSVICRIALNSHSIDAVSFSALRIGSGALILLAITVFGSRKQHTTNRKSLVSGAMLFLYAICFSIAYVDIPVGVGAMILFGSMQITMLVAGLRHGERPRGLAWMGHACAIAGFVCLVKPGLASPAAPSSILMATAGAAWGIYSWLGKEAGVNPIAATTNNFLHAVPMALIGWLMLGTEIHASGFGVMLAILSGALGSGVGYILWYSALKGLSTSAAAMVQSSVPLLVAVGGAVFLSEPVGVQLAISGALIIGGILLVCGGPALFACLKNQILSPSRR
ncbi:MAG TPA: DMT family transporter [Kiritimatiellia bacterium]|nr:DMT family transporter [Kiritimatiellia bacterium]